MGENWGKSGIDSAGFYAYHLLWAEPTLEASYNKLKIKPNYLGCYLKKKYKDYVF